MTAASDTSSRITARSILIDWANKQDQWIRAIVSEAIGSRKPLNQGTLDAIYDQFLREKGLKDGDAEPISTLGSGQSQIDPEQALVLVSLRDVQNVNALSTGQRIDFNPRLTVLFGENGAGKTGYVRILKRLASTRSVEQILPNIGKPSSPPPEAVIDFKIDGAAQPALSWKNEQGIPPFASMDVFDARAATVHVDPELVYVYTPSELALFKHASQAITAVQEKLTTAQRELTSRANPFLARFSRESTLYATIETLGASTDTGKLSTLATVPPDEEAGLESLRAQVAALRSNVLQDRLRLLQGDRDLYASAQTAINAFSNLDRSAYATRLQELDTARERHQTVTRDAVSAHGIPDVLSDAWRAFIEAGERYVQESLPADYPQHDSSCAYCRQPLGEAAVQLLAQYRAYCSDEARKGVVVCESALHASLKDIDPLDLTTLQRSVQEAASRYTPGTPMPDLLRDLAAIVPMLATAQDTLKQRRALPADALPDSFGQLSAALDAAVQNHDGQLAEIKRQSLDRTKALTEESAKLANLEARLTLRALLPEVIRFVDQAKWADKAKTVLARFAAVLRSLTEASKSASEDLLNHDFEKLFFAECGELRAPKVQLEFPGKRGQAARRKVLASEHKLSDVLSEGEQKVIALADFIAEASLRRTATPIIFDDPVNSLDYKRINHIVSRIVALSATRQVILFTHNIWFTMELLAQFEKMPTQCSFYEVDGSEAAKGALAKGDHPRVDTVNHLKTNINTAIAEARKATGAGQDALVERGYSQMRAYCEKTVESELLQGVTERYRPNVMLTRLTQIKHDKMGAAIAAIMPIYEKCCRITEAHAQPLETLSVRPTLADLEGDWKALQDARAGYA